VVGGGGRGREHVGRGGDAGRSQRTRPRLLTLGSGRRVKAAAAFTWMWRMQTGVVQHGSCVVWVGLGSERRQRVEQVSVICIMTGK